MPSTKNPSDRQLRAELKRTQTRLAESEATLKAIRAGDVDAIMVDGPQGSRVFSLQTPEEPYRLLAERMNEGAATLTAEGTILFCNARLAEMVGLSAERLLGSSVISLLHDGARENFPELVRQALKKDVRAEGHLLRSDGIMHPVQLSLSSIPLEDSEQGICLVATDLSKQKVIEHALRLLSACNELLVRTNDEPTLLQKICDLVVDVGGYRMVWIGYAAHDEKKTVRPVAESGFETGYLDTANITWADEERGRGPTGTAIRTRSVAACHDVTSDLRFSPWRENAIKRGYRSTLVLPLKSAEEVLGAISIYAERAEAFDAAEQSLLEELANNLSFGIMALRTEAESKRAEEARDRLAAAVESSDDAVISKTLDGTITYWNLGAEKLFGYASSEIVGKSTRMLFPPARAAEEAELLARIGHGKSVERFESVRVRKDGGTVDVSVTISPVKDSRGAIVGASTIARDITERKRAEDEIRKLNRELESRVEERTVQLRESERRVRRKLESILSPEGDLGRLDLSDILDIPAIQLLVNDFYTIVHIPLAVIDSEGKLLAGVGWQDICTKFHRAHPETCKHCQDSDRLLSAGVTPGEFKMYKCKNNLWDVATPIIVGSQHLGNLFTGQFFLADEPVDYELFRSQARQYGFDEASYLAALERVPRLSKEAVNASMAFLAKLAQLLSQLSYSSIKLARATAETGRVNAELEASVKDLEAFTYAVAHDLRAPLRHIHGFAEMLAEEARPVLSDHCKHQLDTILDSVQHMSHLLEDLLNLSRLGRQDLRKKSCIVNELIKEVVEGLAPEIKNREIEWRIADLPSVECDPVLFKQVLVNLLSNAVKFTRLCHPAIIEIDQATIDGQAVIFIRDNGVGFNMKYADKLFGLFQRLHRQQDFEGTGIGLAIVQRIMHRHGGRVWAEAELDKGATFYLSLGGCQGERKELAVAHAAV